MYEIKLVQSSLKANCYRLINSEEEFIAEENGKVYKKWVDIKENIYPRLLNAKIYPMILSTCTTGTLSSRGWESISVKQQIIPVFTALLCRHLLLAMIGKLVI